jgi:hypothetical protein
MQNLTGRAWFQATDPDLQRVMAHLPQIGKENHDGFLQDLADRPDEIGGVVVNKMVDLPHGNFALLPIFEVENPASGQKYTYEYVSWRYGPQSGAKGIVFVRPPLPGASPTHFITLVGERFAPGRKVNDSLGGFADIGVDGVQSMLDRIKTEIREETGVDDLGIDEVHNLGRLHVDGGLTNNAPELFAAFIDTAQAVRIPEEGINPDVHELKSGALILPMHQLPKFVMNNTDALFQASMLKAIVAGHVPHEWLYRT